MGVVTLSGHHEVLLGIDQACGFGAFSHNMQGQIENARGCWVDGRAANEKAIAIFEHCGVVMLSSTYFW